MLKEIAEVVLIPIAIAGVVVRATFKATDIQKESAEKIAEIQETRALEQHIQGKDVDVTEQFFALLDKPDICRHPGRVKILLRMASFDHSERINRQYLEECPRKEASSERKEHEKLADKAIDKVARDQARKLISALEGSARSSARTQLTDLYAKRPEIVSQELARAVSKNYDNYRLTLGVLVVLGSAPDSWLAEGDLKAQFQNLQNSPLKQDSTFSKWLKRANENMKT